MRHSYVHRTPPLPPHMSCIASRDPLYSLSHSAHGRHTLDACHQSLQPRTGGAKRVAYCKAKALSARDALRYDRASVDERVQLKLRAPYEPPQVASGVFYGLQATIVNIWLAKGANVMSKGAGAPAASGVTGMKRATGAAGDAAACVY
jgi:hypothetical protein